MESVDQPRHFVTLDWLPRFQSPRIMMLSCYLHDGRTTLTLEDDVAARLKIESRKAGLSFKDTVNQVLRRGLEGNRSPAPAGPFKVKARPLGVHQGVDYGNVAELLELVEGPVAR